jgi:enoyl-CoA hydratase
MATSETDVLKVERRGATVVLTLHRPKALNAINQDMLTALDLAVHDVAADLSVRCVVLAGHGKAFAAGADIAGMQDYTAEEAERFAGLGQKVLSGLENLHCPTIAAVGGFALGGGCELAMACDMIFAGARAKFGQPEVRLGVIPGFGGTQRLPRRVGRSAALDLCLTARMVGAEEALRMGLVSRVVEGEVLDEALEAADGIATLGPLAVRYAKRCIHDHADGDLNAALAAERALFGLCFASEDQTEGMHAFLEKRPASFKGR